MDALETEVNARGWRVQNTLGEYFGNAESGSGSLSLNEAYHWIFAHRALDVGLWIKGLGGLSVDTAEDPAEASKITVVDFFPVGASVFNWKFPMLTICVAEIWKLGAAHPKCAG